MDTFEQAFSASEKAADSTLRSANGLVRQIKELQKAAKVGNIAGIKRAQERIEAGLGVLRQEVVNSAASWPFPQRRGGAVPQDRIHSRGFTRSSKG